ncbi:MAG: class I SAM-dependent methyltransferase [Trueperaceae bacterium]|nr:class I SAM-dependent methyltransferase [Trueperaceae bacterium]
MAGTSDADRPRLADVLDRAYPVRDGIVEAHPGRAGELPPRGPAGWVNDSALTARAYEPLWRHRSLGLLTRGATSTAHELRTLRAWVAGAVGAPADPRPLAGVRVLDVGCSAGLYARTLAADGADMVALDASRAFLREAGRRAARAGLDVALVRADAHALPFVADTFDAAVLGATLNELGDPPRAFAELARVVRPGGVLWTMYAARAAGVARAGQALLERGGTRFPAPEQVDAWAAAAGFAPLRRATHGPVALALYRLGAGAPPLAVSSPSPGWEAGSGQPSAT